MARVARKRVPRTKAAPRMASGAPSCIGGMCNPRRIEGLQSPAPEGTYSLIDLEGPGIFLAGHVTKQGGATGLSFVRLQIDGQSVIDLSFAGARNWNLTQHNPYGLVVLGSGGLQTLAFGWPVPLVFRRNLNLAVVVNEPAVVQLIANVIRGSL